MNRGWCGASVDDIDFRWLATRQYDRQSGHDDGIVRWFDAALENEAESGITTGIHVGAIVHEQSLAAHDFAAGQAADRIASDFDAEDEPRHRELGV